MAATRKRGGAVIIRHKLCLASLVDSHVPGPGAPPDGTEVRDGKFHRGRGRGIRVETHVVAGDPPTRGWRRVVPTVVVDERDVASTPLGVLGRRSDKER